MKIENGVLWADGINIARIHDGCLELSGMRLYDDDAANLARYLLRFAETGRLEGPVEQENPSRCSRCNGQFSTCICYGDDCSPPKPKCEPQPNPHSCEGCVVMQNATGNDADQQLARETLAFWEKAILKAFDCKINFQAMIDTADILTNAWLKARERFGIGEKAKGEG